MGFLSWWYGKGPRVTPKDKAILDLKRQRDKIKQYQKRLSAVQNRERTLAKQCLQQGDRKRALIFLRKEQYQKQMILKTDEQLSVLEELVSSIEFAQVQRDVAFGLEQGANVLKEINSEMSLEKIEKIMDDSAEGRMYQEEVTQLLSERITNSDELAVERELEQIELEQTDLRLPEPGKSELTTKTSSRVPDKHPIDEDHNEEREDEEEQEEEGLVAA